MRYEWVWNLGKSLLLWSLFSLGISLIILHPIVLSNLISEDIMRDVVSDPTLLDPDRTTPSQREEGIARIQDAIVAASRHSAFVASFMSLVWLVLATVSDARSVYRPGTASRLWWSRFLWVLLVAILVIFSIQGNNFLGVGMLEETPLSGRILAGFAQKLTIVTTALGVLEFYLASLLLTPPTVQPAVPFALWLGRLTGWLWGIGVSRRGNL